MKTEYPISHMPASDEFYTQYDDIAEEINHYNPEIFYNKSVLLPCDDPYSSQFFMYFYVNFERLKLWSLETSCLARKPDWSSLIEMPDRESDPRDFRLIHGLNFQGDRSDYFDESKPENGFDVESLTTVLESNGDFRNKEIQEIRDDNDIIITNPPFSLFSDFVDWLVQSGKKFIILGNLKALGYKNVFNYIKNNQMWLGASHFNQTMYFKVPNDFNYKKSYRFKKELNGQKVCRVPGICWFTNLEHDRRHRRLNLRSTNEILSTTKNDFLKENGFQHYDNYDAIDISLIKEIPNDYSGVMGVPVTFLDKYCPEQFEIVGTSLKGCHDEFPDTKVYDDYKEIRRKSDEPTGNTGKKTNGNPIIKGKGNKQTYFLGPDDDIVYSKYQRVFIRRK